MSRPAYRYRVYDNITDKLMFEGTGNELAAITGANPSWISKVAAEGGTICRGRYWVTKVEENAEEKVTKEWMASAAAKWDEFVEPLRKHYGIPVYRPGKGEK